MKYFIAVLILVVFCINAKAQTTASGDDKAGSATLGQCNGYSYGVDFSVVKGKTVDNCTQKYECRLETIVKADKDIKPAELKANKYNYRVDYSHSSNEIVQSGQK